MMMARLVLVHAIASTSGPRVLLAGMLVKNDAMTRQEEKYRT